MLKLRPPQVLSDDDAALFLATLDDVLQEDGARAVVSTLLDRLHGGAADYTITVREAVLEQSGKTQRLFDIRNQFVMEAFAVTVIGGLLGIATGLAIAKGVAAYAGGRRS